LTELATTGFVVMSAEREPPGPTLPPLEEDGLMLEEEEPTTGFRLRATPAAATLEPEEAAATTRSPFFCEPADPSLLEPLPLRLREVDAVEADAPDRPTLLLLAGLSDEAADVLPPLRLTGAGPTDEFGREDEFAVGRRDASTGSREPNTLRPAACGVFERCWPPPPVCSTVVSTSAAAPSSSASSR
jgi:hypothetical protein